ncbi:MAG: methyltransferase domain-containing protein [Erysipelotrichaceae bacterium]|nr:methyltransferase domain-containing protein [Erysipelotrichaceae bacterium]
MFWDQVAGVYDIFVNVINRKTHTQLKKIVADLIKPEDRVLECACGTGLLSKVIASRCRYLVATDLFEKMLEKTKKNCAAFSNIEYRKEDIMTLSFPDKTFDKVVAGNVIHLLDEPLKALNELDRVCKDEGTLIIPTYMNNDPQGKTSGFAAAVGKAGADFKRQFTLRSYRQFFLAAGYSDVEVSLAQGRIPCAVAVMKKRHSDKERRCDQ